MGRPTSAGSGFPSSSIGIGDSGVKSLEESRGGDAAAGNAAAALVAAAAGDGGIERGFCTGRGMPERMSAQKEAARPQGGGKGRDCLRSEPKLLKLVYLVNISLGVAKKKMAPNFEKKKASKARKNGRPGRKKLETRQVRRVGRMFVSFDLPSAWLAPLQPAET